MLGESLCGRRANINRSTFYTTTTPYYGSHLTPQSNSSRSHGPIIYRFGGA